MLWDVLVPATGAKPSFYHTGLGVHMLGVYPELGLVIVHRVNTEREFTFGEQDLLQVIRVIHRARLPRPE
jgi:hypothetical protein